MGKSNLRDKVADNLTKPNAIIRKKPSGSFFNTIRGFLTADSFMYGPMMSVEPKNSGKELEEKTPKSSSPFKIFKDLLSNPSDILKDVEEPILQAIEELEEAASDANGQVVQGTYVTVEKAVTTTTSSGEDTPPRDVPLPPSATFGVLHHDPATPKSMDVKGDTELTELTEPEADADEEQSYGHEGEDDFHDHIPLDDTVAKQVANQLIGGLGGRFSDDLGINIDISNDEVERWFLASNFFCRSVPVDVSRKTYKELQDAGVLKTVDLLTLKESRLASILEETGFTKYGQRVASKLQKLATHLEENNWGRITTLKHTSDTQELIRLLRELPGVKLIAAKIFLRELRGVWKGAPSEFDMKTKKAALHLKLLGTIKPSSSPERVLSEFSQSAGIDGRDLEVALYKLGTQHEHHYGQCPGGAECKVLPSSEKLIASLVQDVTIPDSGTPLVADVIIPDSGAPLVQDAAIQDAAIQDAAIPDATIPDSTVPDATIPESGPLPSDILL